MAKSKTKAKNNSHQWEYNSHQVFLEEGNTKNNKNRITFEDVKAMKESLKDLFRSKVLEDVKVTLKCLTKGQGELRDSIKNKEITICSGLAGTGKTYIACAMALKLLKMYPKKYKKIILVKSVTTLRDEEIGYLKGGLEEKMEPFMYSFIHNFEKILKSKELVNRMKSEGIIEILPVAYMRGINIDNSIIIIDECQNLSKEHIITIMTRLGNDSKMIFLGDRDQIDKKNKKDSALKWLIQKFKDFDEIGVVELTVDDVVRNPLVKKILDFLKADEEIVFKVY